MTATTTVTITATEKEWLPSARTITEQLEEWTDYSVGEFDSSDFTPTDEHYQTVISEGSWTSSFSYARKFTTDGIGTFAEKMSLYFPGTYVEVDEEWDSHDADEPGHTKSIYTAGRKHKTFESRLVEVNEKGEVVV